MQSFGRGKEALGFLEGLGHPENEFSGVNLWALYQDAFQGIKDSYHLPHYRNI